MIHRDLYWDCFTNTGDIDAYLAYKSFTGLDGAHRDVFTGVPGLFSAVPEDYGKAGRKPER